MISETAQAFDAGTSRTLRTDAEIRAAGAAAVRGWEPTDRQVESLASLLAPHYRTDQPDARGRKAA